jgi:GNAT superfamily N-acetyltransferase
LPDDTERLHKLANEIYLQHYTDLWTDGGESYLKKSFSTQQLAQEINDSRVRYFFVRLLSQNAGFLKLILPPDENRADGLYLERLYLHSSYTGQGLGKQSLAFADSFAAKAGLARIWLQAMAYRPDVCRFYQRDGYAICGETLLPATGIIPGREKMFVMEKKAIQTQ